MLSAAAGEAYGAKFAAAFQAGFAANNHAETMKDFFGKKCVTDWSDGFKVTETSAIFENFAKTWGFMVGDADGQWEILADPGNKKIVMFATKWVVNITGGFADEENKVAHRMSFILTLDDDSKVANWTAIWDNAYPPMLEALKKVGARLSKK